MSDGNRRYGFLLSLAMTLLPGIPQVQALPHLYYDDLGLINWRTNWPAALQEAQLSGKVILVQITRNPCPRTPSMIKRWSSDEKSFNVLLRKINRCCVSFVADFYHLPPDLKKVMNTIGFSPEQCPIHILLSPQKEPLSWIPLNVGPDELTKTIEPALADKRMQMSTSRDKEVEKIYEGLQTALQEKDARKIQTAEASLQKIAGYGPAKRKSYELLDTAEGPARAKLLEAAKLLREQKTPQAQLALEEAKAFAESLPVVTEINQTLAALKLYDSAIEAERLATTPKQKQQAITQFQQVLIKYPDTTVGTLAYQKLLGVSAGK